MPRSLEHRDKPCSSRGKTVGTTKLETSLADNSTWSHCMSEFDNPDIYKSILESLPTGIYLVDRDRRICFWNTGAEDISGYLRQDVVGHFLRERLLASDEDLDPDSETADALNAAFR